jgi:hypothetical protein
MGKYLKIGDIFEVVLNNNMKGYIQYIADDMTQLNSRVVRAFKKKYLTSEVPSINDITADEIEFYAHVTNIKLGEKEGVWKKIGKSNDIGDVQGALFRSNHDDGKITIHTPDKISKKWYIWRINGETKNVASNNKIIAQADIGSIIWPEDISERMCTGKYSFFYPKYEGEQ